MLRSHAQALAVAFAAQNVVDRVPTPTLAFRGRENCESRYSLMGTHRITQVTQAVDHLRWKAPQLALISNLIVCFGLNCLLSLMRSDTH